MGRFLLSIAACLIIMTAGTSVVFAIDAGQLTDEFSKNESGFRQKYAGRTLTVTGPIYALSLEPYRTGRLSGPRIQLSGTYWRVTCYLNDADKQRALSVSTGDQVTIVGIFVGAGGVGLDFEPCTFK